jgi:Mg/Co/Ni transporter MgtE
MSTKFGPKQIKEQTPRWAVYSVRIIWLLTSLASGWVAMTGLIPEQAKLELMLAFKFIDPLVYGISKMVGVEHLPDPEKVRKYLNQ